MARPRLLDLFCGAGGCSRGYVEAGFEVVGVDVEPQPNYPYEFVRADALEYARGARGFDAVHASPPCKAHTTLAVLQDRTYVDLVAPTRAVLRALGLPYVIENVPGAPLENPVRLCGTAFGLGAGGRELRRHRLFECSFPVLVPPCHHRGEVIGVYGTGGGGQMTRGFKARSVAEAGEALGIDWMRTRDELSQAIPPAYTQFIGERLIDHITFEQGAA